jgi:hypothetical protein
MTYTLEVLYLFVYNLLNYRKTDAKNLLNEIYYIILNEELIKY